MEYRIEADGETFCDPHNPRRTPGSFGERSVIEFPGYAPPRWLPAPHPAPAGLGASLGALALLHARWLHPGAFGALMLQSGSFFRQRWDRQETGFRRFRRISRFVGAVLQAGRAATPIPIALT